MRKALLYGLLGTAAAAGIIMAGLYVHGSKDGAVDSAPEAAVLDAPTHLKPPIRRCMNMGGALEADNEGDWGYSIRERDFAALKRAGFDTVRVPVKFSAHTDINAPYRIDSEFLKRIDQVVDWAMIQGLQIIIDVHHYDALMKNPGDHEPRLEAIWAQLSYHYATAPPNLMFELINEPNDKMTIERTDSLNRRLLALVRRHNPERWVITGSAGWGSLDALTQSDPPQDPRVMTTFHYYDPFELTHQGASWMPGHYPVGVSWSGTSLERAALTKDLDRAAQWRDTSGLPMLLGEFGVITTADDQSRARWAEAVRYEAERRDIGWCYWEWGTGFAAYDLSAEQWVPGMRRALTGR